MRLSTADYFRRGLGRSPARDVLAAMVMLGLTVAAAQASDAMTTFGDGVVLAVPLGQTWTGFTDWMAASYTEAPALVLGLLALVVIPPLALLGVWVSRREPDSTAVSEARTQVRRVARAKAEPRDTVRTGHIPLRPLQAWVEVVNGNEVSPSSQEHRFSLQRTLLRIGRETDNDICLEDVTVHRYHAAIHRTEDAEYVITDLSSARGNGVVVNGQAVAEARLASGDLIELGKARLKFSAAPSG